MNKGSETRCRGQTYPDLAELVVHVARGRVEARGYAGGLATVVVVLERVVDGVGVALAEVEGRVEQLGAGGNSKARNDAENPLHSQTHKIVRLQNK